MKIITGSTGTNHITSDDDRQFNSAVVGTGDYVLNLGNKFAATLVNNNLVQIADGDLCMQGCHARINANTTEDVTIDTGAIGAKRIDLLVARYELNNSTGFEDVQLVIVKGAEDASTPAVPAINDNTVLRNGATIHDMALYKITLDGINVDSVEPMFTVMEKSLSALDTEIDEINSNLSNLENNIPSYRNLDYSNRETLSGQRPTTYTVQNDGIFFGFCENGSSSENRVLNVNVNGVRVGRFQTRSPYTIGTITFPVSAGDVITFEYENNVPFFGSAYVIHYKM